MTAPMISWNEAPIRTWQQFITRVRPRGCGMLRKLPEFKDSILVAGCQRSGTTILSRILTNTDGMTPFQFGKDDELDAALILSGIAGYENPGRHCFQTTYMDNCWPEYLEHKGTFKLVWVVRNPYSVVYSMLNNWGRFALNDVFANVGADLLDEAGAARYRRFGKWGVSRIKRATLSYAAKSAQVFELQAALGEGNIFILDYDTLINDKLRALEGVYAFTGLEFRKEYADVIHGKSLHKADRLKPKHRKIVDSIALPVYEKAKKLCNI